MCLRPADGTEKWQGPQGWQRKESGLGLVRTGECRGWVMAGVVSGIGIELMMCLRLLIGKEVLMGWLLVLGLWQALRNLSYQIAFRCECWHFGVRFLSFLLSDGVHL